MMMTLLNRNIGLALEGIGQNKLRAFLTALGIIFGVFAVVAMLAIGNGAKKSILDQLEIIGTNNIIVQSIPPDKQNSEEEEESTAKDDKKKYSPGLSLDDVSAIQAIVPNIQSTSFETSTETNILYKKNNLKTTLYGVNNDFFELNNLPLSDGLLFSDYQVNQGLNVCILGSNAASRLFLGKNPIGQYVKSKNVVFKVVGVLKKRVISKENLEQLDINSHANSIFIPLQTYELRIENKQRVGSDDIQRGNRRQNGVVNYHPLDQITIKVTDPAKLSSSAELINRILKRRHNGRQDYEIKIPELLIKQQQKTQETLNFILAVIAGISLLVGGIGIMNIMLASVLERIKEIGLRRSIGATQQDIISQFLLEAIAISLAGGIIGVILGIIGAKIISSYAEIETIISFTSILICFGIAVGIGIIFGIMPARKAAKLDPITALRTE